MRMEEIKDKLKQIIIDRLDVDEDQITPDASLSGPGADSLDIVSWCGHRGNSTLRSPTGLQALAVGGALGILSPSLAWKNRGLL